jgi:heme exporter protein A
MLEARNIEAVRGDTTLFSRLDFKLAPGTLARVTGANGSGKTSLLRILCGLLAPAAGEVTWNGGNIRALREEYWKCLAWVGHANALKDDLTAAENVSFSCALAGLDAPSARVREALAQFGLGGRDRLPVRLFSQGQRRRTALARLALSDSLPLWILDEPFSALDAAAVDHVQSLASAHLSRGGMIVLTTHQPARIEARAVTDVSLDGPPR